MQILDVRERQEWDAGHIPGSLFEAWHDIDELPGGLDPEKPVAVVCGSGQRAAVGASLVKRFGANDVIHVVEGGVPKWKRLGNPIETERRLTDPALQETVIDQLRSLHAIKAGALAMFDPMLIEVLNERDDPSTPAEISELLGRMHGAFSNHREQSAEHVRLLSERLGELGASPAKRRAGAFALGARTWVRANRIGGQNHGANARNAFVFEHYEIASSRLLEQLGERIGDQRTVEVARLCLADDQEMAATIDRNWTNVLTLSTR